MTKAPLTDAPSPTLYEDWIARRERLENDVPSDRDSRRVEMQVLDYLLNVYRGSEKTAVPARFPYCYDFVLNGRAIILNHHLGDGKVAGVKSEKEAENRMASILHRMSLPAKEETESAHFAGNQNVANVEQSATDSPEDGSFADPFFQQGNHPIDDEDRP
ncbi:MAG: hypothetical protein N2C14_19735, partial [Planctomycetales bacterium]